MASLLEINQKEDGINIPEVLRPYTGFDSIWFVWNILI
jgi:seryl-tRNA synthetase